MQGGRMRAAKRVVVRLINLSSQANFCLQKSVCPTLEPEKFPWISMEEPEFMKLHYFHLLAAVMASLGVKGFLRYQIKGP